MADVDLEHPNGTRVTIHLPAPLGHVGKLLVVLGDLGYVLTLGVGAKTMTVEMVVVPDVRKDSR